MERSEQLRERLERITSPTLRSWQSPAGPAAEQFRKNAVIDMGWGRIIFGHTFETDDGLFAAMTGEKKGMRDITFYLRDPHVLLAKGPDRLFLDPSHTYRLWMHDYRPPAQRFASISVRRAGGTEDAEAVNRMYRMRQMVACPPGFIEDRLTSRSRIHFVAEYLPERRIIGTVTGVDHVHAFNDPENGASLWSLAVDPQTEVPGVGLALVRHLIEYFQTRGRSYVDLSVMHDNAEAIALYEKLGFQRVPVFCVKRKNGINERFFVPADPECGLNPYAKIIVQEARRRGIGVNVLDPEFNCFSLELGGRSVVCRESLSELTSAVAMSRCDDKRLTHRVLRSAGLNVPRHLEATDDLDLSDVIRRLGRVVVKPARGEQGNGVSVDVRTPENLENAVDNARQYCPDVVIEEFVEGDDLRIVVIDFKVVAAAIRRPPRVTGTGNHTVAELIGKYNRRRAAATGGESRVPVDRETRRCVRRSGLSLDAILPAGQELRLRKAANLHTGGTIHDVTGKLHPTLRAAAEKAARAIDIPVTGLDFLVPDVSGPEYMIIEANERPGLANHEPQPTAQRFIDLLFPQTARAAYGAERETEA